MTDISQRTGELQPHTRWRQRLPLVLFAMYLACYGGFVALNAFWPAAMEFRPGGGVNLAVWYGMALIGLAFVMALLYGLLAGNSTGADPGPSRKPTDVSASARGEEPVR